MSENWRNAEPDESVAEMQNMFRDLHFEAPGGKEGQKRWIEFFKEHNPEAYRELQEMAR